jgi:hypothetical protein
LLGQASAACAPPRADAAAAAASKRVKVRRVDKGMAGAFSGWFR